MPGVGAAAGGGEQAHGDEPSIFGAVSAQSWAAIRHSQHGFGMRGFGFGRGGVGF